MHRRRSLRRAWPLALLPLCSLAFATVARADLTIVQQVDGGGEQGEMTIKIKESKTRSDLAQPVSMITDSATGDTIILQHNRKTFTRVPASQTKALTDKLVEAQKGHDAPKLTDTGKSEVVNGYKTEIFTWTVGSMNLRFWVAKDYPNAAVIQKQLDQLQQGGLSQVSGMMMPKAGQLPGVRLRTELGFPGHKVTTTITSIKEDPVDAALFTPPKEYTEAALPTNEASE